MFSTFACAAIDDGNKTDFLLILNPCTVETVFCDSESFPSLPPPPASSAMKNCFVLARIQTIVGLGLNFFKRRETFNAFFTFNAYFFHRIFFKFAWYVPKKNTGTDTHLNFETSAFFAWYVDKKKKHTTKKRKNNRTRRDRLRLRLPSTQG
eukprot:TRINITY_DN2410_c0_g1_i1.p1 TRINITY_DN2410_c0_g1~~TRINITY_DN2410_c0_g1_i1.p1  ORF type:complete len:151 (+),score=20.39 TRINITY_DN2410_c0_g1_i1:66-518(+)